MSAIHRFRGRLSLGLLGCGDSQTSEPSDSVDMRVDYVTSAFGDVGLELDVALEFDVSVESDGGLVDAHVDGGTAGVCGNARIESPETCDEDASDCVDCQVVGRTLKGGRYNGRFSLEVSTCIRCSSIPCPMSRSACFRRRRLPVIHRTFLSDGHLDMPILAQGSDEDGVPPTLSEAEVDRYEIRVNGAPDDMGLEAGYIRA